MSQRFNVQSFCENLDLQLGLIGPSDTMVFLFCDDPVERRSLARTNKNDKANARLVAR